MMCSMIGLKHMMTIRNHELFHEFLSPDIIAKWIPNILVPQS